MDNDEAKRRWREKNATRAKAIAVDVPGVGQVYVRPLKVSDGNQLELLAKSTDEDAKATIMAGLLCTEDGQRLPAEEIKEWTEIFKDAEWSDYLLVTSAGTRPLEDSFGKLTPRQAFLFDLALELGMTVEDLSEHMNESEFRSWQTYARTRWLPGRRLELLLANIARMTAAADSITPFVFDPALRELLTPKSVATAEMAANAFAAIAGTGRIFKLGQKRKKAAHG